MTTGITDKDRRDLEERIEFIKLTESERAYLAEAFIFVYASVSAADGKMDEKEFSAFVKNVINPLKYHSRSLMYCLFEWLGIDSNMTHKIAIYYLTGGHVNDVENPSRELEKIMILLERKSIRFVNEMKNHQFLSKMIRNANEVLDKLSHQSQTKIKFNFMAVAAEVANASGGFLGFGNKICKEERLALEIIRSSFNIDVNTVFHDYEKKWESK